MLFTSCHSRYLQSYCIIIFCLCQAIFSPHGLTAIHPRPTEVGVFLPIQDKVSLQDTLFSLVLFTFVLFTFIWDDWLPVVTSGHQWLPLVIIPTANFVDNRELKGFAL